MSKILRDIGEPPYKIEIGSGGNPQSGYLHCDLNENMPHLEVLYQMGKEPLPFADGCAEEILSNHSIEHVLWPTVGLVLKDWFRVLQPEGSLFLRTPDLEFICQTYLAGKTTPEHPVDESKMVEVFGNCNASHWANIKLFAGQDVENNVHYLCFDFDMLKNLLERIGYTDVKRLHIQPVFSPGEIQCIAKKPS